MASSPGTSGLPLARPAMLWHCPGTAIVLPQPSRLLTAPNMAAPTLTPGVDEGTPFSKLLSDWLIPTRMAVGGRCGEQNGQGGYCKALLIG